MIGVFDSGLGGLSILAAIAKALPFSDLIYFADIAHVPYGDKDDAYILQRTLNIGRHLAAQGCSTLVLACNTATAVALPALRDALNQHMLAGAEKLTNRLRSGVTSHIAQTVKAWDEKKLVEQLELSVGRDLQSIRYNGTLVGGLIGLLLHALTGWLKF